jgi:hypothetical protein
MTSRLVGAHKAGYPMIHSSERSEAIAQTVGAIADAAVDPRTRCR